jgi:hypothetical protein
MKKHYPAADIETKVLYDQMLKGRFKRLYLNPAYENTCAVRMSYALNRSGLPLGKAPSKDGDVDASDGYLYWIRVSDLSPYLQKQFKGADEELVLPAIPATLINDNAALSVRFKARVKLAEDWLASKLAGRRGIVVFNVGGWFGATGHFTLWDGTEKTLAYAAPHDNPNNALYYFWLTERRDLKDGTQVLIQLLSVKFWELK